jgi:hypothetical protein
MSKALLVHLGLTILVLGAALGVAIQQGWTSKTFELPGWGLVGLGAVAGYGVVVWLVGFFRKLIRPSHYRYVTDLFHKVRWRWQYEKDEVTGMTAHCPECDLKLQPRLRDDTFRTIFFHCDECGWQPEEDFGSDPKALAQQLRRFIDRKIRSGEWKQVVKGSKGGGRRRGRG